MSPNFHPYSFVDPLHSHFSPLTPIFTKLSSYPSIPLPLTKNLHEYFAHDLLSFWLLPFGRVVEKCVKNATMFYYGRVITIRKNHDHAKTGNYCEKKTCRGKNKHCAPLPVRFSHFVRFMMKCCPLQIFAWSLGCWGDLEVLMNMDSCCKIQHTDPRGCS